MRIQCFGFPKLRQFTHRKLPGSSNSSFSRLQELSLLVFPQSCSELLEKTLSEPSGPQWANVLDSGRPSTLIMNIPAFEMISLGTVLNCSSWRW